MTINELIYITHRIVMEATYGIPDTTCPDGVDPQVWDDNGGNISAAEIRTRWETYGGVLAQTLLAVLKSPMLDGQTLWASPVAGEIGYVSSSKTWAKASAANLATTNAAGVYGGNSEIIHLPGGPQTVKFEVGLTLTGGERCILSTNAGLATLEGDTGSPGSGEYLVDLGVIIDTTLYATANTCVVGFLPSKPVLIP